MRLIDADTLPISKEYCVDEAGFGATFYVVHKDEIDNAPTVDAVEVVHLQWDTEPHHYDGVIDTYTHMCPRCRYFYRTVRFKGHNYCPNCGAKMDLEGE